jgi:hypothetical protein
MTPVDLMTTVTGELTVKPHLDRGDRARERLRADTRM